MSELVHTERDGWLLIVRMSRANNRNAINRQLADELGAAFNRLEESSCGRVRSPVPARYSLPAVI
ncbi:hypothetical protein [Nocardia xishanensis]|uniref:hypothetical protein n=1 Tax=Nocardia xishanensis TaxID=238964 RepID=UPI003437C12E